MLDIPVYTCEGKEAGVVQIDPQILGGKVRPQLLKQAVVMYQANRRRNTSSTRGRSEVVGSTRKLYRQKGTGRARMGANRTVIRRGGGVAFAKGNQNYSKAMNKKMRRLARNNAILAKIESKNALVLDGLEFDKPSTRRFASMLRAVGAERSCVLVLEEHDEATYRSGRNIPKTDVRALCEINAYEVLRRKKFIMTRPAFELLVNDPVRLSGAASEAE